MLRFFKKSLIEIIVYVQTIKMIFINLQIKNIIPQIKVYNQQ